MSAGTRRTPPLVALLDPGRYLWWLLAAAAVAVALWGFLLGSGTLPLSQASLLALAVVALPAALKWRHDALRWGAGATVLGILIASQGVHTLEHVAQVVQFYLLDWPPSRALGLITAANVEWVHFGWNWLVWGGIVFLTTRGLRSPWAWLLLGWATLHSLEHSYLLVRYLLLAQELRELGLPLFDAGQSLPGVLGRNGWLALSSLCGRIPGLTTAPRVAIHFWWNLGEFALLLLAARQGAARWLTPAPDRAP